VKQQIEKEDMKTVVEYVEKTFDEKFTRPPYTLGEFVEKLKEEISQEEMEEIARSTSYQGKLRYQDVDIVMGEHMICMYVNHKEGLELTVPTKGIKKLFEKFKDEKKYIRFCDSRLIRGARAVLLHIGWITRLDPHYDLGVAQKWGIGENYPRYGDFLSFVGNDMARKVTNATRPTRALLVE